MINNRIISTYKNGTKTSTIIIGSNISGDSIIPVSQGGTGITSYTIGDLLYADTSSSLAVLHAVPSGYVLISGGNNTPPSYAKLDIPNMITGILPVSNGGINISSYTSGDILYASGILTLSALSIGLINTVLISSGSGFPSYSKINLSNTITGILPVSNGGTNISSYTSGDILYASDPSTLNKLNIGSGNTVLISSGSGFPSYSKINLTSMITGTLPVSNGGTNITSYTIGDILYASDTSTLNILNIGAANTVLISSGSGFPSYSKINLSNMITGILPVSNGGMNLTTYATGDLLYASDASTLNKLTIGSSNNVLISSGSGFPSYSKINLTSMITGILGGSNGGTNSSSYLTGDILYASNSTTLSKLNIGSLNSVLTSNGSTISYATANLANMFSGILSIARNGTNVSSFNTADLLYCPNTNTLGGLPSTIDTVVIISNTSVISFGSIDLVTMITGGGNFLAVTHGGTGQFGYSTGTILSASGTTAFQKILIGSANTVLTSNGTTLSYTAVNLTTTVTGTLGVTNGGTSTTSSTGSTNVVLNNTPTFVTPVLDTPSSGSLTNCTNIPWGLSGVGSTGGGGGFFSSSVTNISSAQIKAIGSSPVTVIPALAGYVNIVYSVILEYNYGTTPYATGTSNFYLKYYGSAIIIVSALLMTSAIMTGTSSVRTIAFASGLGAISNLNNTFAGCNVILSLTNFPEYTAGDGTMVVRILYLPMPITAGN